MKENSCFHCLIEVNDKDAIFEKRDGRQIVFCCAGCQGIYHILHNVGLDNFYEKRRGWKPGPPKENVVTVEIFKDSVRELNGENEIDISLSGIRCASCIWLIEHFLKRFSGIEDIRLNYATHRARIRWKPSIISLDLILQKIISIGYTPHTYSPSVHEKRIKEEKKDLLLRFGTASFFSMQLMLYSAALYAGYFHGIEQVYRNAFQFIAWALATPVMFYSGYPFLINTVQGIRNRTVNMDTLIFMGSFSAYAYSVYVVFTDGDVYFDTSAMIITLILLGRFIETGAKGKASEAISKLMSLQPKEARLIKRSDTGGRTSGEIKLVPVSNLRTGDIIEVIPGDTIPLDSEVLDGSSEVDESMLTGESMPVLKVTGTEVYGGTTNMNGRLVLGVLKTGRHTILAHIIKTVEDAQARKAPIQTVSDSVVRWFIPVIILTSLLTLGFWLQKSSDTTLSLMNAIAVLVIACPCALGLATPLAILIGSTVSSSKGIMIRGGNILETSGKIDRVVLDKTGTLTEGRPFLLDIVAYGIDKHTCHTLAASLERSSEHVIAKALREGIHEIDMYPVYDFTAFPGMGVRGIVDGMHCAIGNIAFLQELNVRISDDEMKTFHSLSIMGKTVTGISIDTELKGWIVIADRLRDEAKDVVSVLKKSGHGICLLTGDHNNVALHVASEAGIIDRDDAVISGVSPLEKADTIKKLRSEGYRVMMVGDGINDAPALTEADVGVAMGRATDIAIQSSDVVLMINDLRLVPALLAISRLTLKTIKQNLFWAFSYNMVTIPLAVAGKIHPIISAALMAASSLMVVGNSLRLRKAASTITSSFFHFKI